MLYFAILHHTRFYFLVGASRWVWEGPRAGIELCADAQARDGTQGPGGQQPEGGDPGSALTAGTSTGRALQASDKITYIYIYVYTHAYAYMCNRIHMFVDTAVDLDMDTTRLLVTIGAAAVGMDKHGDLSFLYRLLLLIRDFNGPYKKGASSKRNEQSSSLSHRIPLFMSSASC